MTASHDRAAPEMSQSSVHANPFAAAPEASARISEGSTTLEKQPASGQPSTSKRRGYISQRLHRMRYGYGVPAAEPMFSPIREVLTSAPSSSAGSRETVASTLTPDQQVACDEERAVSLLLPLPSKVRVRRLLDQVSAPGSAV